MKDKIDFCHAFAAWRHWLVALILCLLGSAAYAVNPPTITPTTGVYNAAPTQATITGDVGASFYFTLDGSVPTPATGTLYTSPFAISSPATIKAIAYINPNSSAVTSAYVYADPTAAAVPRTNLIGWFRSDLGTLLTGSGVNTWVDLSNSNNTATQGTGANQPLLTANAINFWPSLKFNGTSQNLALPTGFGTFSGTSIFYVVAPTAVTAGARLIDLGNGATSNNIQIQLPTSTGAAFHVYNLAADSVVTSASALTLGQFHLLEVIDSGTTATIYTDGVQGATSSAMNTINNVSRANNFIGQSSTGTNFFNGQIAELLAYNTAVSASQRSAIESYVAQRYQIAMQVPTAPIISVPTSTISGPTQVAIAAQSNADIRITTDGSTPTTSSPIYLAPLNVYYTQTVKAIAVINGISSSVSSAAYTMSNATQYPAPSASDTTPLQINEQLPNISVP